MSFIDWASIGRHTNESGAETDYYQSLSSAAQHELQDSLLAADDPLPLLRVAFELLGHKRDSYVSDEDDLDLSAIATRLKDGDQTSASYIAQVLWDLGFDRILDRENVRDMFFGVQVGFECNRRKNVGGKAFCDAVREALLEVVKELSEKDCTLQLNEEYRIRYPQGTKTVDFAICKDNHPRIGIEANFYTGPGSKPTEIKRSYAQISSQFKRIGVELVWVTDGKGYHSMKRSLRDAFGMHPNTYNLAMLRKHLLSDVEVLLGI